jgi:predicted transcriptional regulator
MKTIIKTGTEAEFFKRGRQIAKLADQGKTIPAQRTISFEDPEQISRLITPARLAVFRAVKEHPCSITGLAARLHRDRSAVKRDVDELERYGLVTVAAKVLPGHGQMKEVSVAATQFKLEATL